LLIHVFDLNGFKNSKIPIGFERRGKFTLCFAMHIIVWELMSRGY